MIDLNTYRIRVGCYTPNRKQPKEVKHKLKGTGFIKLCNDLINISEILVYIFYLLIIVHIAALSMLITIVTNTDHDFSGIIGTPLKVYLPPIATTYTKVLSAILISFIIKRTIHCPNYSKTVSFLSQLFSKPSDSRDKRANFMLRVYNLLCYTNMCIAYCLLLLNFLLIAIINPGLLNPGPNSNMLSVAFQNVQGLIPFGQLSDTNPALDITKTIELNHFLTEHKPDILVLNETWLKPSIGDNEVIPNGYKIFRLDRSPKTHPPCPTNAKLYRRNGGGALIAVKSDLEIESNVVKLKCSAEILSIELKLDDGKKIIFCTCYRVGTLGLVNHSEVDRYLNSLKRKRKVNSIYLVGDMNLTDVNWDTLTSPDSIEQSYVNTFCELGLEQMVSCSTHKKGNVLDIVLTNEPHKLLNLVVSEDTVICNSDHFSLKFDINYRAKRGRPIKRTIYNYKRANWDALNSDFGSTDWGNLLYVGNVDLAWQNFNCHVKEHVDKHIPKIKIKSEFQPPWFDAEVHALCRKKERLRSRYKKTLSDEHYMKFSDCRRSLKTLIKQKMSDNFENEDEPEIVNKKFWSYVKSYSNSHRIPEVVTLNSTSRKKPADKADLFNEFFFKQFSEGSQYNIEIDIESNDFDIDFNPYRIKGKLLKINPNKAQGPDEIHGRTLKNCASTLAKPLSILFHMSYSSGHIPSSMKLAHVVPIHKKGSKANVENYRPISLTSIIMKTFEKIIRDELMLRCRHLLDERQHGFLPVKSCNTQMVEFCDSLALSINSGLRTDVIYFDFAKAFDSVNHDIILSKLKFQYNIDGKLLRFIKNYLQGRTQKVVIGNEISSPKNVISGVPQGSIIGPLLFIMFLNDITVGLTPGTNIAMYADDTKIWRSINTENDHIFLQNDVTHLHNWSMRNKMKFHPAKCKVLSVSHLRPSLIGILPEVEFMYYLGNVMIDYCTDVKDLGVNINCKFNWNEHCKFLVAKANKKFGLLRRTCYFVKNTNRRRVLYLSLVRSIFEHCPIVWRPSSKSALQSVEDVQKRAIKWILDDYTSCSNELYIIKCKQLDILPIAKRLELFDLTFFHQVFYNNSPVMLPHYLTHFQGSRLRSSHLDNLCLVSSVTPKFTAVRGICDSEQLPRNFANSFFYRTHLSWNRLPYDIRNTKYQQNFKVMVTKLFWTELMEDVRGGCDMHPD